VSFNSFGRLFRFTTWGESHGPGVPVVRPSNTPDRMRTWSGSRRCVVKRLVPGRRLSSQGWMRVA
jgi:hypothetical protein